MVPWEVAFASQPLLCIFKIKGIIIIISCIDAKSFEKRSAFGGAPCRQAKTMSAKREDQRGENYMRGVIKEWEKKEEINK